METVNAVGRRKTAVARVYLLKGTGAITINHKSLRDYFPVEEIGLMVQQPFEKLDIVGQYNLKINVTGGGCVAKLKPFAWVLLGHFAN